MGKLKNFKVILFDLGGVLLELGDPISTFGLDIDASEFLRTWIMSPSVRALESGQINGKGFAQRIVAEMELPMDWQELLHRFDSWPAKIYPRAIDLIDRIPSTDLSARTGRMWSLMLTRRPPIAMTGRRKKGLKRCTTGGSHRGSAGRGDRRTRSAVKRMICGLFERLPRASYGVPTMPLSINAVSNSSTPWTQSALMRSFLAAATLTGLSSKKSISSGRQP